MRYYIASRWANMKSVQLLTENLRALGHTVFPLVTDERNFVPGKEITSPATFDLASWKTNPHLRQIFEHDLQGIEESEAIILLLPAGKSAHVQAGIAFGLNKKLILIGAPETVESTYLIFNETYESIDTFLASLRT